MINIIGQDKLLNYIDSKRRDTFPRSLILLGESGCGKSTVINYISDKLNLPLIDITDNINIDFITSLYEKNIININNKKYILYSRLLDNYVLSICYEI